MTRKEILVAQKISGLILLALSAWIIWNPIMEDVTPILATIPLGLYLLFTRKVVMG